MLFYSSQKNSKNYIIIHAKLVLKKIMITYYLAQIMTLHTCQIMLICWFEFCHFLDKARKAYFLNFILFMFVSFFYQTSSPHVIPRYLYKDYDEKENFRTIRTYS